MGEAQLRCPECQMPVAPHCTPRNVCGWWVCTKNHTHARRQGKWWTPRGEQKGGND